MMSICYKVNENYGFFKIGCKKYARLLNAINWAL